MYFLYKCKPHGNFVYNQIIGVISKFEKKEFAKYIFFHLGQHIYILYFQLLGITFLGQKFDTFCSVQSMFGVKLSKFGCFQIQIFLQFLEILEFQGIPRNSWYFAIFKLKYSWIFLKYSNSTNSKEFLNISYQII